MLRQSGQDNGDGFVLTSQNGGASRRKDEEKEDRISSLDAPLFFAVGGLRQHPHDSSELLGSVVGMFESDGGRFIELPNDPRKVKILFTEGLTLPKPSRSLVLKVQYQSGSPGGKGMICTFVEVESTGQTNKVSQSNRGSSKKRASVPAVS
ncbi:MAG: hypothetical protein HQ402_02870 [Parcubacteria group bacterium]|nr:hypothetical protein [Parcubacteria group bacterium]